LDQGQVLVETRVSGLFFYALTNLPIFDHKPYGGTENVFLLLAPTGVPSFMEKMASILRRFSRKVSDLERKRRLSGVSALKNSKKRGTPVGG